MALVMTVTDGTNTVTLTSTDGYCLSFGLDAPMGSQELASDQHEIELIGGNSAVATNLAKLNRLLDQARRWQGSKAGPRVFATIQVDGTNTFRSELVDGNVQGSPEQVNYERALGTRKVMLSLVRRNWWEGAEAQISLTNSNGTDNTAGLNVWWGNNDVSGSSPSKKVNWFDVVLSKINGDLPAQYRLSMVIPATAYSLAYSIYKHRDNNIYAGSAFDNMHWLEAVWGTRTADAAKTYGDFYTVAGDPILSSILNLESFLGPGAGDNLYFRFFAALSFSAAGTYKITPRLSVDTGTIVSGTPIYISGTTALRIYDLGLMKYPSYIAGYINRCLGAITVSNPGGVDVNADFLSIVPFTQSRRIDLSARSLAAATIDDLLDEGAIYTYSGSYVYGQHSAVGETILTPGYHHRFYFHILNYASYVTATGAAKLWYRPRYLTI